LRDHRLNGASFRRQVPIKNFIADFVCHAAKLVIELDGGQHFSDDAERADASRAAIIEAQGFKVLRFSNLDVMENCAGVLETIATAVAERAPTLTLPHKREREWTAVVASIFVRNSSTGICKITIAPSARPVGLPLPLAGEGWGGGVSASEVSMVDSEHPDWKVSSKLRSNARALRKTSTDAERLLWAALRDHRLNGASFRRQVPIRNFIADFVCHAAKLVIELDGGQHFSEDAEQGDAARSTVIEAQGFKVLRFSNLDVMENCAGVLETIATAVAERAPTLTLPRKREREQQKPSS
jgi:very-short-patch-repair endonuclease